MATRERPGDRGRRRASEDLRRLGVDHRNARRNAGLSSRDVARATRTSHQQVLRFEAGLLTGASIADVGAWCAVVGLDLVVRAFPGGDPIRDAAVAERSTPAGMAREEGTDGLMGRLPFGLPGDTPLVRLERANRFTLDDVRVSWSGYDSTPPWVRRIGALSNFRTDPYQR
jgi:hypothetical protein